MRKIKPKMTRKEREIKKANYLMNEKCKPLFNVGTILSAFCDFLQEHKNLFDNKECYLKPSLKDKLALTIDKTKNFIQYNYIQEHMKTQVDNIKKIIEENFNKEINLEEERKKGTFKNDPKNINYRIFKTYACASICISTIFDMFYIKEKDNIYNDFKNKLKNSLYEFRIYNDFWQKEVQEIKIKLI